MQYLSNFKTLAYLAFFLFVLALNQLKAQGTVNAIVPKQEQLCFTPKVIFNWNDNHLETATSSYSFFLSQDSTFNTTTQVSHGLVDSKDSAILVAEGVYYWKVELLDNTELIANSSVFSFTYSNPLNFPNMTLLLRSDTGVIVNGSNEVERWLNLADTSNSAMAATTLSRPSFINNSNLLNTNVVRFNGIDDLLEINASVNIAELYCIANWGGTDMTFPSFNGLISGKSTYFVYVASRFNSNFLNTSTFPTFRVNNELTRDFAPLNEFKILNVSRTAAFTAPDMQIGRDRGFSDRYWNGDIAEIITFSSPLSDSSRNIVEGYLCDKYSEEFSLGSDIISDYGFCDTTVQANPNFSTYLWSNGDTTSFSVLTPGNNYQLTVTNEFGCTFSDEIAIIIPIETPSDQLLCIGDTFIFNTSLLNAEYNFLWSDSSTDSVLVIDQPGDYYVMITDTNGCSFNSDTLRITYDSSLVNFTLGEDTTFCRGNEIEIANATALITSYLYSTGDTTPTAVIDTTGIYNVQIGNGMCFHEDTIQVTIQGEAPAVDFSFDKLCINEEVLFTDITLDPNNINLTSHRWEFGDGDTSTLSSPLHRFDSTRTFQVSLEVLNDSGCVGREVKMLTINNKPTTAFNTSTSCELDSTVFIDQTIANSGVITNYLWDFGVDGVLNDTSRIGNPVFTYPNDSLYPVRLITENSFQCIDTLVNTVKVNSRPFASFMATRLVLGDSTNFINNSTIDSGLITINSWNFGDGSSSLLVNPSHFYTATGNYNVDLFITSDSGCSDRYNDLIQIVLPSPTFNTVYPKMNQTLLGVVDFEWNRHDSALSYQFQLATDSTFSNLLENRSLIRETNLSLNLYNSNEFFWRVFAVINATPIDTTNIGRFNIFNPKDVDSLTLWLTGDSVALSSGGSVMSWFDLSDSARILTQTRVNNQPNLVTNYINGKDVIDFPGNRPSAFVNVFDINTTNYYISSVYNFHAATSNFERLLRSSGVGSQWEFGPRIQHGMFVGNQRVGTGLPIVPDRFVVNTAFAEQDTTFNIINGIPIGQIFSSDFPKNVNISAVSPDRMDGAVAEIIVIDGGVSKSIQEQSDEYLMNKYAPPINLGRDRVVCGFPDTLILNKDYIIDYEWSTGDTTGTLVIDSAGLYFVKVTDMFGRESIDSIFYLLDTNDFVVSFIEDTLNSCLGGSEELFVGEERFNYTWNTGDTTSSLLVDSTATYSVSVENCLGNITTDDIVVIFNEPKFSLGPDVVGCFNNHVQLSPDSAFNQVNYSWSTNETSTTITADTVGEYSLLVTDQFGCSFSDTITVGIDSTLLPLTLGPDTLICTRNEIGLINRGNTLVSSYLYSTGNTLPTQVIDTAGIYTLRISNGLCFKSDTIVVTIKGEAPTADFSSSVKSCLNDSIEFNDLSTTALPTDVIVSWNWDFDDGNTAIIQDPKNVFNAVSNYKVALTVETDKGCFDAIRKDIQIQPLPIVGFNFSNQPACSKQAIDVLNNSTIASGLITNYHWNFGDPASNADTAITPDANYTYDTTGNYIITLKATSNFGCVDSIQQLKFINPTPIVNYTRIGDCLADSVTFIDNSTLASGNVRQYSWIFNEIPRLNSDLTILDSVITRKFINPGLKTVIHRLQTEEECVAILRDTFEIFPNPVANFIVPAVCEEDSIAIINTSTSIDAIVTHQFVLNNRDTIVGRDPKYSGDSVGIFNLDLTTTTINGCIDSISKTVQVNPKPQVNFEVLNDRTGIPFTLKLENTTIGASNYLWNFGGGDTSTQFLPNYTYQDTGMHTIQLVGTSAFGCVDSFSKTITAFPFFLDALLSRVFVEENNLGEIEVSAQIVNNGFNTIDNIKLTADLNNDFEVSQVFETEILRGGVEGLSFSNLFSPESGRKVDFICLRIAAVNGGQDSILTNNEICERTFGNEIRLEAYPNPVDEFITFEFVLPDDGMLTIQFYDQLGREILTGINQRYEEGYYTNIFNTISLRSGVYNYRFIFNGVEKTGKFLKQ